MSKRLVSMLLAAGLVFLSGCRLARPEAGNAGSQPDRMVGAIVTMEPLSSMDLDVGEYLAENFDPEAVGQFVTVRQDPLGSGRIWAVCVPESYTDENGIVHYAGDYEFPGIDGLLLASYYKEMGSDSYRTTSADAGLTDVHTTFNVRDDAESIELSATVYAVSSVNGLTLYLNPVYMAADGSVYALSGNAMGMDAGSMGGSSMSISEDHTGEGDAEFENYSAKVTIALEIIDTPVKYVVHQMDEAHQIIASAQYEPGKLPGSIEPEKETAYIMVETWGENRDGEATVQRTVYNPDDTDSTMQTFYAGGNGICSAQTTVIFWAEA